MITRDISLPAIAIAVGGALVAGAPALPWFDISIYGTHIGDNGLATTAGQILIALGLAIVALAIVVRKGADGGQRVLASVFSLVSLAILIPQSQPVDMQDFPALQRASASMSVGIGIWVGIAGAALAVVGALVMPAKDRQRQRPDDHADVDSATAYVPCPTCSRPLPARARRCPSCSSELSTCEQCGGLIPMAEMTCRYCGLEYYDDEVEDEAGKRLHGDD